MARSSERNGSPETLEEGDIYFIYRPEVRPEGEDDEPAEGLGEVQNFYLVLKPHGGRFRLINVGRKRLPEIDGHERNWGFVDMVAGSGQQIEQALRQETYDTKTRGARVLPAARPAGEGVYALLRIDGRMQLAWALELPEKPGPVQKAFNIPPEASLAVSIKNPEKGGGPRGARLSEEQKADYPKELQKEFRDRRFATEDPRLLDYEGAEIIFVGARSNPEQAYRIDLQPEDESEGSAEIFKQLRFAKSRHPREPLLKGEWR
jgi:hypothetical protein